MKDQTLPVTFGTFHGIYYGILKWAYGINQSNLLLRKKKRFFERSAGTDGLGR